MKIPRRLIYLARNILGTMLKKVFPEFAFIAKDSGANLITSRIDNTELHPEAKLYPPYHIWSSNIGKYTYIAQNCYISFTSIGKYCSIGPNFMCGWGIHPTNGLSTAPMFYSTLKQNGISLSETDKIIERKQISIGNDVFIGMNVTILDGITIGDGAIIGAGAVVSKDIPPYAIAAGSPIQILKYRFDETTINRLLEIRWWDFPDENIKDVEKYFFDIQAFLDKYDTKDA